MLRKIKILHLEPTDVCQAACPMCAREKDTAFNKELKHHLKIEQINKHCSKEMIADLDKMFMCGVYGDPAAGRYTMDIYDYFRKINPDIVLGMNTNGSLQTPSWWKELGRLFNQPRDYCVFSIDGLEDTNHIYRRNVIWTKLMENAEAYIAAGGSAHWDMLVYRHNQHQVEKCEQLAKNLGFKWFRAKVSKRGFNDQLQFPVGWHDPSVKTGPIVCQALKEQSMYIDAQGRASACCWLGSTQTNFVLDDIETVQLTWDTDNPNPVCKSTCSTVEDQSSFGGQWQREVEFV